MRPPTTFEETVERLGTAIRIGLLSPGSKLPPERERPPVELETPAPRAEALASRPPPERE